MGPSAGVSYSWVKENRERVDAGARFGESLGVPTPSPVGLGQRRPVKATMHPPIGDGKVA